MIAAFTATDIETALATAALIGAAFAVLRSVQLKSSFEMIRDANDELRNIVADEQQHRERDQEQCQEQLAEMSGQVKALTGQFGAAIAASIVAEWQIIDQRNNPIALRKTHRQGDPT